VSPMGARPDEQLVFPLKEQIAILENAGAATYVIEPDKGSREAIGINPLLPETRLPAAEAGRSQALAIASEIARFWQGDAHASQRNTPQKLADGQPPAG
jgi:hypothetical protein